MTDLTIREVPAGEREALARAVERWGYPRRITAGEILHGTWIRGRAGVIWFTPGVELGDWMLHGCARPGCVPPRELASVIRLVAGLLGARRVYCLVPPELLKKRPALRRYVRCIGFRATDALGPYFELDALDPVQR